MPYQAKVIADSLSPNGDRLTTLEVTYPRFVHSEFMTHRVFSRNSASSRAIPARKTLEKVSQDPVIPLVWPGEQKGMQGGAPLEGRDAGNAEVMWLQARDDAVKHAENLAALGVHKSLVNRILEPWMWHTVIVTATDWQNFFDLRCNPLAEPHIEKIAVMMRDCLQFSDPLDVDYGEYHMPYIRSEDWEDAKASTTDEDAAREVLLRVSSARCARVSYLTHDGRRSLEDDLKLAERLSSARPMHASPFEHVATPCQGHPTPHGGVRLVGDDQGHLGNFSGWDQFRHEIEAYADVE